jgi:hypothetical protein
MSCPYLKKFPIDKRDLFAASPLNLRKSSAFPINLKTISTATPPHGLSENSGIAAQFFSSLSEKRSFSANRWAQPK